MDRVEDCAASARGGRRGAVVFVGENVLFLMPASLTFSAVSGCEIFKVFRGIIASRHGRHGNARTSSQGNHGQGGESVKLHELVRVRIVGEIACGNCHSRRWGRELIHGGVSCHVRISW